MRETLVFTPKWAATDNPKNLPFPRNRKPQMTAWENYVRAMFERYGNRVEYFEIWNEPDLTGFVDFPVEDYIGLCRTARRIARGDQSVNQTRQRRFRHPASGVVEWRTLQIP